jgi:hypothetical protein
MNSGNPLSFQVIKNSKNQSFMMNPNLYLNWAPERQHKIIYLLKQKARLSWTELARHLKVNRSMALHYNKGRCRIPLRNFNKLCYLAHTSPNTFQNLDLIEIKNKERPMATPSIDENLAEFLGFLSGDGCITTKYSTVVSCDATSDYRYIHETVFPKFQKLFGLTPTIRKVNRNLLQCRVYSKKLFLFLSNKLDFPIGKKKDRIRIPGFIYENNSLAISFLRGLFDTDGGFHRHNPFSSKVEFTSYSRRFRDDIAKLLKQLGFKPVKIKTRIYIMSRNGIDRFFEIIKPHNPKHLYKYYKFKQVGQVPRHRDIDYNSDEFKKFVFPN